MKITPIPIIHFHPQAKIRAEIIAASPIFLRHFAIDSPNPLIPINLTDPTHRPSSPPFPSLQLIAQKKVDLRGENDKFCPNIVNHIALNEQKPCTL